MPATLRGMFFKIAGEAALPVRSEKALKYHPRRTPSRLRDRHVTVKCKIIVLFYFLF